MTSYLIEFRFQGKTKHQLREIIWDVDTRCRIGNTKQKRPVPHISLAGPFTTNDERQLIQDFYNVCSKQDPMSFTLKHFSTFEHSNVVYFDINPDHKLDEFRWNLSKKIKPYCNLKPHDHQRTFHFHSTIAMKLTQSKFQQVKNYVSRKELPHFRNIVLRVTLLKGGLILKEYDFMQRKMFDRKLAKSKYVLRNSMNILMDYLNNKKSVKTKKESIFTKFKNLFKQR